MQTDSMDEIIVTVATASSDTTELAGQTVSGTVVLSVEPQGWMKEVRFYVDGELAATLTAPPFELVLDTTQMAEGPHTARIEALMPTGKVRTSEEVEFVVAAETTPENPEDDPEPAGPVEPDPSEPSDPEPTDPVDPEPEPGTPPTELPTGMVEIKLGSNVQAVLDAHPAGTSFYLRAGVHRNQTFSPSTGDTIVGEPGAILSGARLLTEFRGDGALWYAPNQTQYGGPADRHVYANMDICIDNHTGVESPRCNYPEDLFFDDVMLKHVASKADVRAGTWFFDYDNDRIYFADDPTGHRVETSVTSNGISANGAKNVVVRNIIVEKYAVQAQSASLHTGAGWLVEDSVFRYNHGIGIRLASDSTMRSSRSHHNGQLGVSAIGDRIVIEDSEIDHNNTAGYATGWAGGGTKFTRSNDMRISNTNVHDNDGPGLWFDWDNRGSVSYGNRLTNNSGPGFLAEASYDLVIRDNHVVGNGFARTNWLLGAGILVNTSNGVLVTGNVVRDNYHGVTLIQAKEGHELGNVEVRDNLIGMERGQTGMVVMGSIANKDYYFTNDISFIGNEYEFGGQSTPFKWASGNVTFTDWQRLGMDGGSSSNIRAQVD